MATSIGFSIFARDDGASSTFLKVASASKLLNSTFSDLGSNTLGLTKLIGGAGLIPVLAGAAGAATSLATAMGAAAGAGGIFALSAGKTFADMVKQRSAITSTKTALALLTPGTAAYATQLAKLHTQQKNFNADFGKAATGYDKMTSAFGRFQDRTSKVSQNVLGKGFSLIASVLPRLVPVSNAAGKAIGGLLDDLRGWTKGPAFAAILKWFQTSGPKAITHFGHSVGNIFVGLGGILKNFVGPGDRAAKSLQTLTARFAKWGNSKGVSDSVNKFLAYVGNNGPKIVSVFSSLAMALPKVASSMGGLGSANLTAISMFLRLLASLPQGVFDVVVKGLFGILVAAKALSIIAGVNSLISGMSVSLTAVKDACLLTRIQLGLLWAQEKIGAAVTKAVAAAQWLLNAAMDANPIGLVVVAIGALVVGMVIAYKKSETFRKIVQGAFAGVKAAASAVADFFTHKIPSAFGKVKDAAGNTLGWVKSHWPVILAVLSGPFGLAVLAIAKNWGRIKAGASNMVSAVTGFFKSLPGKIKGALGNLGKLLWNAGTQIIQGLISGIQSKVSGLLGMVGNLAGKVSSAFKKPLGIFSPSRVFIGHGADIIKGLIKGIESQAIPMQTVLSKVVASVQAAGQRLKSAIQARNGFASGFQSFSTSVFGGVATTDASGNTIKPTAASIIAFQKQQAVQAAKVKHDVRKLVRMGLSPALIKQLQSQGAAGIPEIEALAHGSRSQIHRLNALNRQTSSDLHSAGMSAANRLYGDQIQQDRKHYSEERKLLQEIRDLLKSEHGKKNLEFTLRGRDLVAVLKKEKRVTGVSP